MTPEVVYCYMDWNVYDNIEKKNELPGKEKIVYSAIEKAIIDGRVSALYSNAHLSDLKRGYLKNPTYIDGHLKTIARLTNNFCIVQYWGNSQTVIEQRDVFEFFNSLLGDTVTLKDTFTELINDLGPEAEDAMSLFKMLPLPENLVNNKDQSPIMKQMFSSVTSNSNYFDLFESFNSFLINLNSDNQVYKDLKKNLNEGMKQIHDQKIDLSKYSGESELIPGSQILDKVWQKQFEKNSSSANKEYTQVMSVYSKFNFKGHNSDERYLNMIDDSLHTFYAGHCHYFISFDKKCRYKAIKTYEELGVTTKVLSPEEFYEIIK